LSTKCIFGEDTLRSKSRNLKHPISFRHPEFSSGSAFPKTQLKIPDEMLKQVQHDAIVLIPFVFFAQKPQFF